MRKMMVGSMLAVLALVAVADWTAPIQVQPVEVTSRIVTNVVERVAQPTAIRLQAISISCSEPLTVTAVWEWVDEQTNVVKRGATRMTEAEVDAALQQSGFSVEQMKNLFLGIAAASASAP